MNLKLFISCMVVTFVMIGWLVINPGKNDLVIFRIATAVAAMFLAFYAIVWNQQGSRKKVVFLFLGLIALATALSVAFTWGMAHSASTTMVVTLGTAVMLLIYLRFVMPRRQGQRKKSKPRHILH